MAIVRLLYSSREASAALSISERTLWTLTHEGKIPVAKVRGANRYHIDDLLAFIEACKAEPPRPTKKPRQAAATPDGVSSNSLTATKQSRPRAAKPRSKHDTPKR